MTQFIPGIYNNFYHNILGYFWGVTLTMEEFGRLYMWGIVWLHEVLVSIVSDRETMFMAHFWKSF